MASSIHSTCALVGCNLPAYQGYRAHNRTHGSILDKIDASYADAQNKPLAKIEFYEKQGKYYELTNFYENNFHSAAITPVVYNGTAYKTSEHAFQATKFSHSAAYHVMNKVIQAVSAREAFDIARANQNLVRHDWAQVKDQIMYEVVKAKFSGSQHLRNVLEKTNTRYLIEASPVDNYWGAGANGNGQNKLGLILMRVREELRMGI